ncbi:MAG: NAD(P)-dependent oxidoreductase [Candidatus Rokubacteria bacterium]|nr:NAD(P)-dependent oxidoreductase [Candidatus Rokubacteria bacterium]
MRVLVTGASGLIGMHATEALRAMGTDPIVFDTQPFTPPGGAAPGGCLVVPGDVTDRGAVLAVLRDFGIDRIVHLAAVLQRSAQDDPLRAAEVNIRGSLNVLDAARTLGIRRVVVASSIAVYGPARYDPIDEQHPCSPTTVYGAGKLFVEHSGHVFRKLHGLEFVALRYGATFGPGPRQATSAGAATELRSFFEDAVRAGAVSLWGPEAARPLGYVKDAALATALACLVDPAPASSVFNVAGSRAASMAECADVLGRLLPGLRVVRRDGTGMTPPMPATLAIDRAAAELGYQPRYPLADAITDYVAALRAGAAGANRGRVTADAPSVDSR